MNILKENVEHIIIQNEETGEIITEITQDSCDVIKPFVLRMKEKKPELIQTFEKDFEKFNETDHPNYTYQ